MVGEEQEAVARLGAEKTVAAATAGFERRTQRRDVEEDLGNHNIQQEGTYKAINSYEYSGKHHA